MLVRIAIIIPILANNFGLDKGADIPIASEFTHNLKPLLDNFGADPRLTLILFNLDETPMPARLAPLAGHYPALKLGPPWWFHDSLNGMHRYFDRVVETAGIYNTAGFNDDTRAYPSIPARHDVWRRAACDWVAGLLVRHIIDENDAHEMARALVYDLAQIGLQTLRNYEKNTTQSTLLIIYLGMKLPNRNISASREILPVFKGSL